MPSDIEIIIGSLDHLIERMQKIKDDDEIKEGGDILLKDIEDNIKNAERAKSAILELKNDDIIKLHTVIVGIALKLRSKDLVNSMNVLNEKFHGVNLLLDDSHQAIEKCNELYTRYCE